jgi:negative regulator of sigma E activity
MTYTRLMRWFSIVFISVLLTASGAAQTEKDASHAELSEILQQMSAHEEWQNRHLVEYQVQRKFYASNQRFKMEAALEVNTTFRKPDKFDSQIVKSDGSKLIRERVFDKILDAEKEAQSTNGKEQVSIVPANYKFTLTGKEECDGRPCHRLQIIPKKKDRYSINGHVWVDAEDGAIVRIQGSPAKRPSFWTLNTQIDRRYKRLEGVWLCETMESTSDIFIGGRSMLKIEYNYLAVQTENGI